jgi:hypothetical protein
MNRRIEFILLFTFLVISSFGQTQDITIIGELISSEVKGYTPNNVLPLTRQVYKVLDVISGKLERDTIEFQTHHTSFPTTKRAILSLQLRQDGSFDLIISENAYYKGERKLYAFVGEKISLEAFKPELPEGYIRFDNAFKAKYRIIQNVYDFYPSDTIEFEVYDHYGNPAFASYKNVLLYVSEGDDGKLYHEKYMYSPVYETSNDKWAGTYAKSDYCHAYNVNSKIQPEKIEFRKEVKYSISELENDRINKIFPAPYYKIDESKSNAIAVMGNYVEDLVRLKLDGFLKARGYINY